MQEEALKISLKTPEWSQRGKAWLRRASWTHSASVWARGVPVRMRGKKWILQTLRKRKMGGILTASPLNRHDGSRGRLTGCEVSLQKLPFATLRLSKYLLRHAWASHLHIVLLPPHLHCLWHVSTFWTSLPALQMVQVSPGILVNPLDLLLEGFISSCSLRTL